MNKSTSIWLGLLIAEATLFGQGVGHTSEPVKVRIAGFASCSPPHKPTMRKILAERGGDLQLRSAACNHPSFSVSEVISGRLHDSSYASRPVGVNTLAVYLFNDAVAGLPAGRILEGAEGIWTLRPLSDGNYAVFDVADTPFHQNISKERKRLNDEIESGLKNNNPEMQHAALQKWDKERPLWQLPLIIDLIDSTHPIIIPGSGHVLSEKTTLGALARKSLMNTANALHDRPTIKAADSKRSWLRWWAEQLKTVTSPALNIAAGNLVEIGTLRMNQSHPEFLMSQDGGRAFVAFTRLESPANGARSGILYYDLSISTAGHLIYKVPLDNMVSEPTQLRAAWSQGRVGLIWQDSSIRFLLFSTASEHASAPIDLKLNGVDKMALISHRQGWALVYTTKEKKLFVQVLDPAGHILGAPLHIDISSVVTFQAYETIYDLSAVDAAQGPAISIGSGAGAFLVLLDTNYKVKTITPFSDPKIAHTYYRVPLGWNGTEFCIPWLAADNAGEKLFVSFFDPSGKTKGTPRSLSNAAEFLAIPSKPLPAPHGDGFMVLWGDTGEQEHVMRLASVASSYSTFKSRAIFKSKTTMDPMAVGAGDRGINVMIFDKTTYPFKVLIKRISN